MVAAHPSKLTVQTVYRLHKNTVTLVLGSSKVEQKNEAALYCIDIMSNSGPFMIKCPLFDSWFPSLTTKCPLFYAWHDRSPHVIYSDFI